MPEKNPPSDRQPPAAAPVKRPFLKRRVADRKWLLLPVETISREFPAKLLLACLGAERGWGCLLGKKAFIRKKPRLLPDGVVLEKSIAPSMRPHFERTLGRGNRVTAWCEEGLAYLNRENYRERRLDPKAFETVDCFFAWGERQANDIVKSLNRGRDKLILSGNPRFDLLRPELRSIYHDTAREYRRRYGRIILVNTRFSGCNGIKYRNRVYLEHMKRKGQLQTAEQERFMERWLAFQRATFEHFLTLVPRLADRYRDHTVIIRPHPAEDNASWEKEANGRKNVRVLFEGSANDWIMASEVLVHNNCTTGIEAFLLDRPAISYRPVIRDDLESQLANAVSHQAGNPTELFTLIDRIIKGESVETAREKAEKVAYLKLYVANTADAPLACEVILDALDKLDLPAGDGVFPLDNLSLLAGAIKRNRERVAGKLRNALPGKTRKAVSKQFPGLTLNEVQSGITLFQRTTGRFQAVKCLPVAEDIFCIYRE